jgi:hypothetical protein
LAEVVFEVDDGVDEHEVEGDVFAFVVPEVGEAGGISVPDGVARGVRRA